MCIRDRLFRGSITFTNNFIWGDSRGQTSDWGATLPPPLRTLCQPFIPPLDPPLASTDVLVDLCVHAAISKGVRLSLVVFRGVRDGTLPVPAGLGGFLLASAASAAAAAAAVCMVLERGTDCAACSSCVARTSRSSTGNSQDRKWRTTSDLRPANTGPRNCRPVPWPENGPARSRSCVFSVLVRALYSTKRITISVPLSWTAGKITTQRRSPME